MKKSLKIFLSLPELLPVITLSLFLAVGAIGMGNALAADCGDTDSNGVTDTTCACGDTVVGSPGYIYTLPGDLSCPGEGHGLIVGATDITIDGDDHYIDGVSGHKCEENYSDAGIYMGKWIANGQDFNNVTIKNLEITNFCHGIWMQTVGPAPYTTGNRIESCVIHDNGGSANYPPGGDSAPTQGIAWNGVDDSVITNCIIYNQTADPGASGPPGGIGIYLCSGDDNEWSHNEVYDNAKAGMFLRGSPWRAFLHHNSCHDNTSGIRSNCINDRAFIVEYNDCSNNVGGPNGGYGIFFGGADDDPNIVRYNVCQGNRIGISFERDAWVGLLDNNTACNNIDWDIYVQDYAVVTGDNNTCDTYHNYNDQGTTGCTYACTYPLAKFRAASTIICTNANVQFTDLSLADPSLTGCAITSWSWDVDGDGSEDYTIQNPQHAYTDSGIYDVSLTVTQSGGTCSGSDSETMSKYIRVCPYKGDFDGDTDVDGTDMHEFYTNCLQGSPPAWCDVNGDGSINASDMDNVGRSDCAFCP